MKANELMIGDWVYCEGQPTPENVTIQTIAEDGVWFDGPNYEGAASYDRIFPIPLTPEILEKNGFVEKNIFEDTLGFEILGNESLSCGVSYDEEDTYCFETFKSWTETDYDGAPEDWGLYVEDRIRNIRYVHELQHALRLCGIKKEIIL